MAGLYMFYLNELDCNCIDFITMTERGWVIFHTPEWKIEIPFISLSGQDNTVICVNVSGQDGAVGLLFHGRVN